jgi:hypothetical protein
MSRRLDGGSQGAEAPASPALERKFRASRLALIAATMLVATASLVIGVAAAAGPTPGTVTGWEGIRAGDVRYVAVNSARDTVIERIDTRTGRVLRFGAIPGLFGIPLVAFDGTTTGITRDGASLVLSTFPVPSASSTRFAVVSTRTLKERKRFSLRGLWSLDALSPNGNTLFLIEYLAADGNYTNYRVRAYDLVAGRLVAGAIVDKREPDSMTGLPMTRTTSADGAWAFTLYSRDGAPAFVHALDTAHRAAVCIDLPWKAGPDSLLKVRMKVVDGTLLLTQRGVGRIATVDLKTYAVTPIQAPVGSSKP